MRYQLLPTTLLNVALLLVTLAVLCYGLLMYRRQRHRSELLAFVIFTSTICLWQLDSIVIDVVTSPELTVLASNVFNAVIGPLFVYTFCWFVLAYTDNEQWVNRWTVGLVVAHIAIVGTAFIINPEFMYTYGDPVVRGPATVLTVTFEPWVVLERSITTVFLVYQLYTYVLIGLASAVLARYLYRNREDVYPGQVVALGLGVIVPSVSNVLVLAGIVPLERHFNDIAIGVTSVMFAVAVFRYRLLRVAPVGRKQVVETMADLVVLVDDEGSVVDANRAARRLVGAGPAWRGTDVVDFFSPFPEQAERFRDIDTVETEISLTVDGTTRHFDLSVAPIRGPRGDNSGHVLVMREVTPLKEREAELDLMRQIQSRVLRHNIRNDLQTVRLYSEHLSNSLEDEHGEMAEKILTTTDGLLSVSEKTRVTEQLIEGDQTPVSIDLSATLANLLDSYRESHPDVTFSLSAPDACVVETIPAMEFAFENLVENAAQHNEGSSQRVDITVTESDGETTVEIRDDGPGIPEQELDVVRSGEETQLEHGTGVGLWAVQWVLDSTATATIEYETDDEGTVATLRFPGSVGE